MFFGRKLNFINVIDKSQQTLSSVEIILTLLPLSVTNKVYCVH